MIPAKRVVTALVCIALVGVIACGKSKTAEQAPSTPEEAAPAPVALHVTGLELGRSIDAERKISAASTTFGTHDTIYVSVATEGTASSATLAAKWTFGAEGQLVNEMSQPIAPTGPANTEFHIARPKAWPVGSYKVEVSLDGVSAGVKDFEVKN
jgi:hypothetical protein